MRLWTIQTLDAYEQIEQTGYLQCDPDHPDVAIGHDFTDAYDWLVGKMCDRIGDPPQGVTYPIWAWHTTYGLHKKPDLRHHGYGRKGCQYVILEIEVPDADVVLTDYNAWHYVLNKWYYDDSTSEAEWDRAHAWFDDLPPAEQTRVMQESWDKIFNIEKIDNGWMQNGFFIQATFWLLKKEYILKRQFFTAR